jgi:hypothetical protein
MYGIVNTIIEIVKEMGNTIRDSFGNKHPLLFALTDQANHLNVV